MDVKVGLAGAPLQKPAFKNEHKARTHAAKLQFPFPVLAHALKQ